MRIEQNIAERTPVKVYIQKKDGEFIDPNCYQAYFGFQQLGYEVVPFEKEHLSGLSLQPETVVHGHISVVFDALRQLGIQNPPPIPIPTNLMEFCGRRLMTSTLGEVRSLQNSPVFIKPLDVHKQFDGHVVREFRDLIYTAGFPDEYPVMSSEYVEFVSEYRVFVLRNEVVAIRHYKGNFRIFPAFSVIDAAVARYEAAPAAFALDFGVTVEGRTLLVEINDSYSLGCYGLDAVKYARMIEARWKEITQTVDTDRDAG